MLAGRGEGTYSVEMKMLAWTGATKEIKKDIPEILWK